VLLHFVLRVSQNHLNEKISVIELSVFGALCMTMYISLLLPDFVAQYINQFRQTVLALISLVRVLLQLLIKFIVLCVLCVFCIPCSVPNCYINCSNKLLNLGILSAPLEPSLSCSLYPPPK